MRTLKLGELINFTFEITYYTRFSLSFYKFSLCKLHSISWQRRESVKGESIARTKRTAFSIHFRSIQALAANFCGAQSRAEPKDVVRCRPPVNYYKMNIDACVFPNGSGTAGAIIRDDKGGAIAGLSYLLTLNSKPC
jgi:hypothetical protein